MKQQAHGEIDESYLESKVRDLQHAFTVVNRKNYELECKLAKHELDKRAPASLRLTSNETIARVYDLDKIRRLQKQALHLKHESRRVVLRQNVCPTLRSASLHAKNYNFERSKIEFKYQMLQNEIHALVSNSPLAQLIPPAQMSHSTPVR